MRISVPKYVNVYILLHFSFFNLHNGSKSIKAEVNILKVSI